MVYKMKCFLHIKLVLEYYLADSKKIKQLKYIQVNLIHIFRRRCPKKQLFRNISPNLRENIRPFYIKLIGPDLKLIKKDSNAGVFLWILRSVSEQCLLIAALDDCLYFQD